MQKYAIKTTKNVKKERFNLSTKEKSTEHKMRLVLN